MHRYLFVFILCLSCAAAMAQKNTDTPSPFMEEIIKNLPNVRDVAIYGQEVYFTLQSKEEEFSAIVMCKKEKNKWSVPKVVQFSGRYHDLEPFITSDGLSMYFASNRPVDTSQTASKDYDIWYVTRSAIHESWSAPRNLGAPVNTKYNEFYPSLGQSKNIYYTSDRPDSKGLDDIFLASFTNGAYNDPISLSDSINTAGYEFNAFVAPDESYIIYTGYNRPGGFGSGDLYISLKDKKGNWTGAKNLGSLINSDRMDYCPWVDTQTKTLYFTSKRNEVTTQFTQAQTLEALLIEFNKYQNGSSRLYLVSIKKWLK
jgi:hypothetical protein